MLTPQQAADWLRHFGYSAVEEFQEQSGLAADGDLGPKTIRAMDLPRCGVVEPAMAVAGPQARDPGRDYQAEPILYAFRGWVWTTNRELQRRDFQDAFSDWSKACGVAAREALPGEQPELEIDVRTRREDRELDGAGRTLAYAYVGGGLIVFDGDETWRPFGSTGRGTLFRNVACHEIGHILNLYHSRVDTALMAPIYSSRVPSPVSPDDVERGLAAYGEPFATPTTTTPPPPPQGEVFTGQLHFRHGRLERVQPES